MRAALVIFGLMTAATARASEPALVVAEGAPVRAGRVLVARPGALVDRDTGAVVRRWGSWAAPGASADAAIGARAARAFVEAHLVAGAELALVANRVEDGRRTVVFQQTWRGWRVVGAIAYVVIARDRVIAAGSEAVPGLRPSASTRGVAIGAWLGDVRTTPTGERVVLPIVRTGGGIEARIAEVVEARRGLARWDVYVAPGGAAIARASRVRAATATLLYDAPVRYPQGARALVPAIRAGVVVDGTPGVTGDDGTFAWPGTANVQVGAGVSGPLVRVTNVAGPSASTQQATVDGGAVTWSVASDELADAQVAAFVHASRAKAAARRMYPGLAWLDQQLPVVVNHPEPCTAFSNGDDIHFGRAGAACENTARLADIVHHEFGHSFHFQTSIFGMTGLDHGFVEGVADFFAAHVVGDAGIGRGLHGGEMAERELDPIGHEHVYPVDVQPDDAHRTGLIASGALWDLRKLLIARLGAEAGAAAVERIFVGILRQASDLPTMYPAALVADDDDADAGNGTPHGCEIELAFGRHGLVPGFRTTVLTPRVEGREIEVVVERPERACLGPRVTSIAVALEASELPMEERGGVWRATLPAEPEGTITTYQLRATLEDGQVVLLPDNPADPRYQLVHGEGVVIACETMETDPRWAVTGDPWEWAVPIGETGDPGAAFSGAAALGIDLRADGAYRRSARTAIAMPAVDARGYGRVQLQFRRWLTVEDARYDRAVVSVNGAEAWSNARGIDHLDREWRLVAIDVTGDAAAGPLEIEWSLAADNTNQYGGWTLDEVCVIGFEPECPDCDGCCASSPRPGGAMVVVIALWVVARRRRVSSGRR